jgi:hypothetical protein
MLAQLEFEMKIDTHEPVTPEKVIMAIEVLLFDDYESLCRFLEPQTEEERQIINDCLRRYENGNNPC